MWSINNLILIPAILLTLYSIWRIFFTPIFIYLKAGIALGFDKVALVYKPFTGIIANLQHSTKKYGNSYGFYLHLLEKNPNLKIVVFKLYVGTQILVTDVQMINSISQNYSKDLSKINLLIFGRQIEKGLVFTEKQEWRKSRSILSNLFHFQAIRSRQPIMEKVITDKIQNLDGTKPHSFKLGGSIAGEILVKSLFGQKFFDKRFGNNNPFQEIQQLMAVILQTTTTLHHITRIILFGRAQKDSRFLTSKQKSVLSRLLEFKRICKQYLHQQKINYENKQPVAPFLEAYFKLQDDSYFEEIVHQLFLFLFAGEDTTGSLFQMCLAILATYPQHQQKILQDVQKSGIYGSKVLSNFINQVCRWKSPVGMSISRFVQNDFVIEGFQFSKGYQVQLSIAGPALNPKYWQNPKQFNPQRFMKPIQNHLAFIPFFSGPRNCIGQHMALMQIKLSMVKILRMYRLVKVGSSLDTQTNTIINYLVDSHYVEFFKK